MGKKLRRKRIDAALRYVIQTLDYDLHKSLECDEDSGEDVYDVYVALFIRQYNESTSNSRRKVRP